MTEVLGKHSQFAYEEKTNIFYNNFKGYYKKIIHLKPLYLFDIDNLRFLGFLGKHSQQFFTFLKKISLFSRFLCLYKRNSRNFLDFLLSDFDNINWIH